MRAVGTRGSRPGRRLGRAATAAGALAVLLALQWLGGLDLGGRGVPPEGPPHGSGSQTPGSRAAVGRDDTARIADLFEGGRSGVVVEARGEVARLLPDDREGSRHQRFVLLLDGGQTLLVAHNIDLAPRVPLQAGDVVRFRGQYEWNDRGGVVHWTHHDPDGHRPGGWLEHEGRRYR